MNLLRVRFYLLLMVLGLGLCFGGVQGLAGTLAAQPLSDQQIIEKAKDLGMVELKEAIQTPVAP